MSKRLCARPRTSATNLVRLARSISGGFASPLSRAKLKMALAPLCRMVYPTQTAGLHRRRHFCGFQFVTFMIFNQLKAIRQLATNGQINTPTLDYCIAEMNQCITSERHRHLKPMVISIDADTAIHD